MSRLIASLFLGCASLFLAPQPAWAIVIDWAGVGNPGNVADTTIMNDGTTGYGSVGYNFLMGKYEVSNTQYAAFLNAVATTDTHGLYNSSMGFTQYGGILQSGSPGSHSYSVKSNFENFPVNYVSWGDAARFANWMANGQPTGPQSLSTTENGSYLLNGATSNVALNAVTRTTAATIFIPNEDEWYKAAYYNPAGSNYYSYPTSSNTQPSNSYAINVDNNANFYDSGPSSNGFTRPTIFLTDVGYFATSESPSGTFDQGGSVWEWNDAVISMSSRGPRGGSWFYDGYNMASYYRGGYNLATSEHRYTGFRLASVPEPSTFALAVVGIVALDCWARRRTR